MDRNPLKSETFFKKRTIKNIRIEFFFFVFLISLTLLASCAPKIFECARDGDGFCVRDELAEGKNVNAKDEHGKTALHHASWGEIETVKLLLESGAGVDSRDVSGKTPLHHASRDGKTGTVKLLLESGAEVDSRDVSGKTPLHHASKYGKPETVRLLLEHGAGVDSGDGSGETPLHGASKRGRIENAELLLEYGAEVNAKSQDGSAPLSFVGEYPLRKKSELEKMTQLLVGWGADVGPSDSPDFLGFIRKRAFKRGVAQGLRDRERRLAANRKKQPSEIGEKKRPTGARELAEARRKSEERRLAEERRINKHTAVFGKSPSTLAYSDWKGRFGGIVDDRKGGAFARIQTLTQRTVTAYLSLKDRTFPEKVPQPVLLPRLKLKQGEFESGKVFEERVQKAIEKRKTEIENLQAEYRDRVERRNRQIAELQALKESRRSSVEEDSVRFAKDALFDVMQGFTIAEPVFDRETGVLSYLVQAEGAAWSERIGFEIHDPQLAERMFKNPDAIDWEVRFWVESDGIELREADFRYAGKRFAGRPVEKGKNAGNERLEVVIESDKLDRGGLASLDALQRQNPNLVDRYRIGAITYNDGRQVDATFNDDIPDLLKQTEPVETDPKKWLVAIGVEKYEHTDPIAFSRRSSELFVETARKTLGISERNTYAFLDGKATSGNIKDRLRLFLRNVKPGDTVYFYYSGHGIPVAAEDNEPYFLPADKVPDFIGDDPFFKLRNVYKLLSDSPAGKVVAFVDSCFTGSTDGVSVIKGVAATRLAPKKVVFDQRKMVTITAGRDKQYSNMYQDKGHRLFTYFLIKSLLSGKREVKDIFGEVSYKVSEVSASFGDLKKQEPIIEGNHRLSL